MPNEMTSGLVGYALDGFGIYGMKDRATGRLLHDGDLDACHGTTGLVDWDGKLVSMYHYVLTPEYPYTVGCFRGTPVSAGQPMLRGGEGPAPGGEGPGGGAGSGREQRLARAAQRLGISIATLRQALGPPPPDLAAAARKLGVSEDALREALGPPPGGG